MRMMRPYHAGGKFSMKTKKKIIHKFACQNFLHDLGGSR